MRPLRALGFLAIAAVSAFAVVKAPRLTFTKTDASARIVQHPPLSECLLVVTGPTRLYYCSDWRSWAVSHGRWVDAGAISPAPVVPA